MLPEIFFTYMLHCNDESFYIGWTKNIQNRLMQHNFGHLGARYTRIRRPVILIYLEVYPSIKEAMRREYQMKKLTHAKKLQLSLLGTTEKTCYYTNTLNTFIDNNFSRV